MKEITLAELIKKKKDLEKRIASCVDDFQLTTGVKIYNIYNTRTQDSEENKIPEIHVTLDI